MADDTNKIGLEAVFEDAGFQEGISEYNSAIEDASINTEEATGGMSAAMTGMSAVGAGAWATLTGAAAAGGAALYQAVGDAAEVEDVMARLNLMVANTGEKSGITAEMVTDMADKISSVAPFDDEVIVSAATLAMQFDNITADVMPQMMESAVDLAAMTGRSLPQTMRMFAMSMSDPTRATRLLRQAGVTLTEEQKKQLEVWVESGDIMSAQAFILDQVSEKVGGAAEAMGDTYTGKMTILQTAVGNLSEEFGAAVEEGIKPFLDKLIELVTTPEITETLQLIGEKIGEIVGWLIEQLPDLWDTMEGIINWIVDNKPIVLGVMTAIIASMAVFAYTAISTMLPAIGSIWAAFAPAIPILLAISTVVALIALAWENNFGGIQEKTAVVWAKIKEVFGVIVEWLQVNIPIAIDTIKNYWETVLLPAFQTVWAWVEENLVPIFVAIYDWLATQIPIAIDTLSAFWTDTLLPAIKEVWDWIETYLIPTFENIWEVISGKLSESIGALSELWTTVLLPAITEVWEWIETNLMPLFNAIAELVGEVIRIAFEGLVSVFNTYFLPAIEAIWGWLNDNIVPVFETIFNWLDEKLSPAFTTLGKIIESVTTFITGLTDKLKGITIPPYLTPGSPTPFEMGLRGINEQIAELAGAQLPSLSAELSVVNRNSPSALLEGTSTVSGYNLSRGQTVSNSTSVNLGGIVVNVPTGANQAEVVNATKLGVLQALRATGLA